jgi:tape measure domain-containing protein
MIQESKLRIIIDSRGAEKTAQRVRQELQGITTHGEYATKSMDAVSVGIRQLVGQMAGIVTVGAAISKMDAYTGMQNRLKLVTESQEQLNLAMSDTFSIAQKTRSSWENVIQVYQRFQDNAKTLNIDMAKTAELTETVSKAVAISGASTEGANAALVQFGQSLASGVFRGEEFNSVAEQAPGLLKAIATGLGVNIGQLRAMANDGKLTSDILVKALSKAKLSVDELFAKTDVTIGQSLQLLSNEVTKFTGEAGKASGVATTLASSIQILANNLDAIAGIAVVGGVALLTKTILAQTVAIQSSISAVVARRAADTAAVQSQIQLTALEVQRTRQVAALALTEINLARQELNSATTRQARAAATMRLTQAEIAHSIALKQSAAAVATQTAAENALNASRSRGAMLLGLVGGPIGAITIGVAALTAGYMYLQKRTAEANAKLEEQGRVAEKTKEELLALKGVQLDVAKDDLAASFEAQNEALRKADIAFNGFIRTIANGNKQSTEAKEIYDQVRQGLVSQEDAIERLNKLNLLTPEQKAQGLDLINSYDEAREKAQKNAEAQKVLGVEVKLAGNAAQNASPKIAGNTKELKDNESAAQKAAKAQKDYFDSLHQDVLSANERLAYMNLGFSKEIIDQINKLQEAKQKALGDGVTAIVTTEEIKQIVQAQNALDAVKNKEDEITQAKREQNKEAEKSAKLAEKQAVIMAGTNEQTKNMLKVYQAFRNAGVDDMKARVLTAQVGREGDFLNKNLFGSHTDAANRKTNSGMISWQGSRSKSLTQYLQGQGVLDKKGNIEQTQEALNAQAKFFIQEIMTEKRYSSSKNALLGDSSSYRELEKVFGKNAIAWDYNGKNIGSDKAAKNLARQDNYYNSLNKILGGNPENALSSIKDLAKYDDEAYKARKDLLDRIEQLQSQYDTEAVARSKARDEEILQATILSQNDLIPKIKERYDAEDKLAKLQQEFDIEGHKWTEERKLQYTYDTNVLRLTAEGKFSEDQKKIFEKALKEQYEQEKAFVVLAWETRMFQMREALMSETAAMQERYRLEREQILLNSKLSQDQKKREIALSKALQEEENRRRLNNAVQQWGGIQAEMNGTGNQYRLEQERFGRIDSSQNVFNSQMDQVDQAAQDPNANIQEIAAQREAIWQAHHDRMTAIESDYQASSYSLQLGYGQQVTGALSGMFGAMLGESSSAYRALYGAQQAFALSMAGMNVWKSASDAYANEPGTWYQKAAAAAIATLESGTFVSLIQAATPKGFAEGGFTGYGGKYEPAGIVHKWEGVLTKEEMMAIGGPQGFEGLRKSIKNGSYANGGIGGINNTARNTHRVGMGAVSAINSNSEFIGSKVNQPKVTIINQTTKEVNATSEWDGDELKVYLQEMRKQNEAMMDAKIEKRFRMAGRQGWK